MRNFVVFFLLGLAVLQLSGATETQDEKEISVMENQEDVQAMADPGRKGRNMKMGNGNKGRSMNKGKGGRGKSMKGKGKGGKGSKVNNGKGRRARNMKGQGKKGKGSKAKKGKGTRGRSMKGKGKRGKGSKANKGKGTRRRNMNGKGKSRKGRKENKSKGKLARNKKKSKGNGKKGAKAPAFGRQACIAGCSDLIIGMMKAARKQNTYLKQYNRIVNVQKQAAKKGGKKDQYGSNTKDGPLKLLISAGGGNKSDLSCAGSKDNEAAKTMANLTAKLESCEGDIKEACNVTKKMVVIKEEWVACSADMKKFKGMADACLKLAGTDACTCFSAEDTVALKDKVIACNGTEMQIAAAADLFVKKACMKVFGECRSNGEDIRPVLSACQAGGASVAETTKKVGAILKNSAANDAIIAKTTELVAAAAGRFRKRASVTFEGNTYPLDTCAQWSTAALAWIAALDSDLVTDISAAGGTIATTDVTCTADDVAALTTVSVQAAAVSAKAALEVEILQEKLEQITGTTIAPAAAIVIADATTAAVAGATTAAAAANTPAPGGVTTAAMKMRREAQRIMAEFRKGI